MWHIQTLIKINLIVLYNFLLFIKIYIYIDNNNLKYLNFNENIYFERVLF